MSPTARLSATCVRGRPKGHLPLICRSRHRPGRTERYFRPDPPLRRGRLPETRPVTNHRGQGGGAEIRQQGYCLGGGLGTNLGIFDNFFQGGTVPLRSRGFFRLKGRKEGHCRGVATKFCLGRGRIHRHPNPPTPKFSFSSDFGHFVLKMMENAKITKCVKKKEAEISSFLGGRPRRFFDCGGRVPPSPPPAFDAHGHCCPLNGCSAPFKHNMAKKILKNHNMSINILKSCKSVFSYTKNRSSTSHIRPSIPWRPPLAEILDDVTSCGRRALQD